MRIVFVFIFFWIVYATLIVATIYDKVDVYNLYIGTHLRKNLEYLSIGLIIYSFLLFLWWVVVFFKVNRHEMIFTLIRENKFVKLKTILQGYSLDKLRAIFQERMNLLQYSVYVQAKTNIVKLLLKKGLRYPPYFLKKRALYKTLYSLCMDYKNLDYEIIRFLQSKGANINFVSKKVGLSLVDSIILREDAKSLQLLLESGARINYVIDTIGYSPLMCASYYCENKYIIMLLLKYGANINFFNKDGYNAILIAAGHNPNPSIINTLVEGGAYIRSYRIVYNRRVNNVTPLRLAAVNNNSHVIQELINLGDDVNYMDSFGMSPLFVACMYNSNSDVIKTLLFNGANIDALDSNANTPLMAACFLNSNSDIIRILIDNGANDKIVNKQGLRAADLLQKNDYFSEKEKQELVNYLRLN